MAQLSFVVLHNLFTFSTAPCCIFRTCLPFLPFSLIRSWDNIGLPCITMIYAFLRFRLFVTVTLPNLYNIAASWHSNHRILWVLIFDRHDNQESWSLGLYIAYTLSSFCSLASSLRHLYHFSSTDYVCIVLVQENV
ncbi:hypothetical protein K474DRAFT_993119 [Panus rudis PR-1116 ss-1]|nr:hypothetical protein K474DRAFT_993119 [Panus rudis PR-1116 ss-1]